MPQRWSIDQNPFCNLYVDLTKRCNMDCNFCYNPKRDCSDLGLDYFAEACRRLPQPVSWRFLGGEPTLHPQFFAFVDTALSNGHKVFFNSNGSKFLDELFMTELARYRRRITLALSMDGGTRDRSLYRYINNRDCLDEKMRALANLRRFKIKRVSLSAIILRNRNEQVVRELRDLALQYRDVVRWIHFRNAGRIGRWVDTRPYSLAGLKRVAREVFSRKEFAPRCVAEINCNGGDGECCYRFRPTRLLQVSLIEFATARSAQCPYRGKLLEQGHVIERFFANMIEEGLVLSREHGRVNVGSARKD